MQRRLTHPRSGVTNPASRGEWLACRYPHRRHDEDWTIYHLGCEDCLLILTHLIARPDMDDDDTLDVRTEVDPTGAWPWTVGDLRNVVDATSTAIEWDDIP